MNSASERWVQTCRRELLERTLIWNQHHLLHALCEFEEFYNSHRPHQGIANAQRPRLPHAAGLERHQHGRWVPATRPASGGERLLAVSVPLFAAAELHQALPAPDLGLERVAARRPDGECDAGDVCPVRSTPRRRRRAPLICAKQGKYDAAEHAVLLLDLGNLTAKRRPSPGRSSHRSWPRQPLTVPPGHRRTAEGPRGLGRAGP